VTIPPVQPQSESLDPKKPFTIATSDQAVERISRPSLKQCWEGLARVEKLAKLRTLTGRLSLVSFCCLGLWLRALRNFFLWYPGLINNFQSLVLEVSQRTLVQVWFLSRGRLDW